MSADALGSGAGTLALQQEKKTGILRTTCADSTLETKHPFLAPFKQSHASSSFKLGTTSPKGGSLSTVAPNPAARKTVKVVGGDKDGDWDDDDDEDDESKEDAKKQFRKMAARRASCPHNVMSPVNAISNDDKSSEEESRDRWSQQLPHPRALKITRAIRLPTHPPGRASATAS